VHLDEEVLRKVAACAARDLHRDAPRMERELVTTVGRLTLPDA
jgi:hypothetical protein